jgi:hypothetical protein
MLNKYRRTAAKATNNWRVSSNLDFLFAVFSFSIYLQFLSALSLTLGRKAALSA